MKTIMNILVISFYFHIAIESLNIITMQRIPTTRQTMTCNLSSPGWLSVHRPALTTHAENLKLFSFFQALSYLSLPNNATLNFFS